MYRLCHSVSVISILCIKVDKSFMGELLQDVNKIRVVLYFLKALCCIWANFAELPDGVEL